MIDDDREYEITENLIINIDNNFYVLMVVNKYVVVFFVYKYSCNFN
jgi:hypothetical protein